MSRSIRVVQSFGGLNPRFTYGALGVVGIADEPLTHKVIRRRSSTKTPI